ncbi:hypothetical protein, partial [Burkholderia vietnamiensis]|uniref:hypothetical protein n=1 Tax=Burkholderia vietnamiensis TaxID=60552 RepID=UPI002DD4356D
MAGEVREKPGAYPEFGAPCDAPVPAAAAGARPFSRSAAQPCASRAVAMGVKAARARWRPARRLP